VTLTLMTRSSILIIKIEDSNCYPNPKFGWNCSKINKVIAFLNFGVITPFWICYNYPNFNNSANPLLSDLDIYLRNNYQSSNHWSTQWFSLNRDNKIFCGSHKMASRYLPLWGRSKIFVDFYYSNDVTSNLL
jgi:hypothetical protein